jgi:hypothetical protein
MGEATSVDAFFKYGTDPTLTIHVPVTAGTPTLSRPGSFSTPLSGLTPKTTYYFQACTKTATDDVCSGISSFYTVG